MHGPQVVSAAGTPRNCEEALHTGCSRGSRSARPLYSAASGERAARAILGHMRDSYLLWLIKPSQKPCDALSSPTLSTLEGLP